LSNVDANSTATTNKKSKSIKNSPSDISEANVNGNNNDSSEDLNEEDNLDQNDSNGMAKPVIYAWMKKVHMNNPCK
jgi:hypothetical protein